MPTVMINGVYATEFCCLYIAECQDIGSSSFSSTVVPTKEDLRDSLVGKVRREDRGPPTVFRNGGEPTIYAVRSET